MKNFPPKFSNNKVQIESYNYNFKKDSYNAEQLSHYLSKEEFEQIVDEVNKLISKSMKTKKEIENTSLSTFGKIVVILSLLITVIYIVVLYLSASNKYDAELSESLFILSIVLMSVVLLLIFIFSNVIFFSKIGKFSSLDEIIKSYLNKYLSYINNYFEGYLEWVYIPSGQYIEVNILNYIKEESESLEIESINNGSSNNEISGNQGEMINTEKGVLIANQNYNEQEDFSVRENKRVRIKSFKQNSLHSLTNKFSKHKRIASMTNEINIKNKLN